MDAELQPDADIAATKRRGRPAGQVIVATFALHAVKPAQIVFSEHMPRFEGRRPFDVNPDLVWGVFGTDSINRAAHYASMDASHLKRRLYHLDLIYSAPQVPSAGAVLTKELTQSTGYVNFPRLEAGFREALRSTFLGWLEDAKDPDLAGLSRENIESLLRERPMLVHRFMAENPEYRVALHSVRISGGIKLRMATLRRDPQRMVALTRYHDEIETLV
ncbi:MAG: hypothetical protein V4731_04860 [Pseudomonadota bacterium]